MIAVRYFMARIVSHKGTARQRFSGCFVTARFLATRTKDDWKPDRPETSY
jgi:hypothetical protein